MRCWRYELPPTVIFPCSSDVLNMKAGDGQRMRGTKSRGLQCPAVSWGMRLEWLVITEPEISCCLRTRPTSASRSSAGKHHSQDGKVFSLCAFSIPSLTKPSAKPSVSSDDIPRGVPWNAHSERIGVTGPLQIAVHSGAVKIFRDGEKIWSSWGQQETQDGAAEKGDIIEALDVSITVWDRSTVATS